MKKRAILVGLLLLGATILRLYRIEELTEFLGDQGSAGIVIYESFHNRTIPLVGPIISTGQRPGPFYYYLIALPLILSNFNPLVPALGMALLGVATVYLVYVLATKLYGFDIGFLVATIYAVSPTIIRETRTMWNPTPIPFFIVLVMIAFYKIFHERKLRWFAFLGMCTGILIQFHYTNLFVVLLSIVFGLYVFAARDKEKKAILFATQQLVWIGGFLLVLSPFILYELMHNFADIRELILLFLLPHEPVSFGNAFVHDTQSIVRSLFGNVLPVGGDILLVIALVVVLLPLLKKNFWHTFFVLWFIGGALAVVLYPGGVFGHYLNFLLPLPFFLFGSLLFSIHKNIPRPLLVGIGLVIVSVNIARTDIYSPGVGDISRTRQLTEEMIRRAQGNSFSFTLISSRSFSDLHYRYFLRLNNVSAKPITSGDYQIVFLICEKGVCPSASDMEKLSSVQSLCFDFYCNRQYPTVSLEGWKLIETTDRENGRMYTFTRTPQT